MRSASEQDEKQDERALDCDPRCDEVGASEMVHPDSIVAGALEGLHHIAACMVALMRDMIDLG
jgi:hypothetical protein